MKKRRRGEIGDIEAFHYRVMSSIWDMVGVKGRGTRDLIDKEIEVRRPRDLIQIDL